MGGRHDISGGSRVTTCNIQIFALHNFYLIIWLNIRYASFCFNFPQNVVGFRCSAPHTADELTALTRPKDQQLTSVGTGGGGVMGGRDDLCISILIESSEERSEKRLKTPALVLFIFIFFTLCFSPRRI